MQIFKFSTFLALVFLLPATLFAQISMPEGNNVDPIVISAQAANRWQQGTYEVWLLRGDCRLVQGDDVAVCQEAVFWIDHAPAGSHQRSKVIAYLEGNVGVRLVRDREPVEIRDQKWFGRFFTVRDVQVSAGIVAGKPNVLPGIYQRGMDAAQPGVRRRPAADRRGSGPVRRRPTSFPRPASRRRPRGRCRREPRPFRQARGGFASRRGATCRCRPSGNKIRKRTRRSPSSTRA